MEEVSTIHVRTYLLMHCCLKRSKSQTNDKQRYFANGSTHVVPPAMLPTSHRLSNLWYVFIFQPNRTSHSVSDHGCEQTDDRPWRGVEVLRVGDKALRICDTQLQFCRLCFYRSSVRFFFCCRFVRSCLLCHYQWCWRLKLCALFRIYGTLFPIALLSMKLGCRQTLRLRQTDKRCKHSSNRIVWWIDDMDMDLMSTQRLPKKIWNVLYTFFF